LPNFPAYLLRSLRKTQPEVPRFGRRIVLAVIVVISTVGAAGPHPAAADEVHFDPDSPAGKEYALPLSQARDEATGGGDAEAPGGGGQSGGPEANTGEGETPLFGVGVGADSTRGPGGGGPAQGQSGEPGTDRSSGPASGGAPGTAALLQSSEAGSSYPLTSGALLLTAILLLGIGLGVGLRSFPRATRN
jgi:hypothetical protein